MKTRLKILSEHLTGSEMIEVINNVMDFDGNIDWLREKVSDKTTSYDVLSNAFVYSGSNEGLEYWLLIERRLSEYIDHSEPCEMSSKDWDDLIHEQNIYS